MLGDEPSEAGEVFLVLRELSLRHAFVAVLDEHAADHVLVNLARCSLLDFANFKEADVLGLVLQKFESVVVESRSEQDFNELALEEFGSLEIDLAGHCNYGTESGHRVTSPSGFESFTERFTRSKSTRIHVLHDHDSIAVTEFASHFEGCVSIDDVVERKFLAPELLCRSEVCFGAGRVAVEYARWAQKTNNQ